MAFLGSLSKLPEMWLALCSFLEVTSVKTVGKSRDILLKYTHVASKVSTGTVCQDASYTQLCSWIWRAFLFIAWEFAFFLFFLFFL